MLRIGIDIQGGDFAPEASTLGSILAFNELPSDVKLVLIGKKPEILNILDRENFNPSNFEIVHADEVIGMGEHPAKSFSKKKNSSIAIGFKMLGKGEIDGFASAGSTGAMLVGTMLIIRSISGIIRPCITASVPNVDGSDTLLMDVGINPDCRPDVLYQYAMLGSMYVESVYKIENPRVGLLNIGSEEEKGNLLTKATHELMKGSSDFNFIGNVEGSDFFNTSKADIVICDGFTGNVVLKEAEAFYTLIKKRNLSDPFFERFNFENYGGTPILGVNSNVIIGHGVSNPTAIKNMILHTKNVIDARLVEKFKEAFKVKA
ncbi:MAG: phosphate acyltransferase [Chlorobi bacterium]|nr:phosphate acyltransferase [Chlorobiota bacterium]